MQVTLHARCPGLLHVVAEIETVIKRGMDFADTSTPVI